LSKCYFVTIIWMPNKWNEKPLFRFYLLLISYKCNFDLLLFFENILSLPLFLKDPYLFMYILGIRYGHIPHVIYNYFQIILTSRKWLLCRDRCVFMVQSIVLHVILTEAYIAAISHLDCLFQHVWPTILSIEPEFMKSVINQIWVEDIKWYSFVMGCVCAMLLQVSDQGGGIPRSNTDLLFNYMFSTAPQPPKSDAHTAPLAGRYTVFLVSLL
jgi:hypothetical protein